MSVKGLDPGLDGFGAGKDCGEFRGRNVDWIQHPEEAPYPDR